MMSRYKRFSTGDLLFTPSPLGIQAEKGEIGLINGDVPRIVINAIARVEVDRIEPKSDPPGDQRKEDRRRMKT